MSTPAQTEQQLTEVAWRHISTGFVDRNRVAEAVLRAAGDTIDEPSVRDLVDRLWHQRLREQWYWSPETDCDRLDAAFAELVTRGLLVRQHYHDCLKCGFAAITAEDGATASTGFVFFDESDTQAAARGEGLQLAYGAFAAPDAATAGSAVAQIGATVCAALRDHGLLVSWSQSIDERIFVDLQWRKRIAP
ncbi:MAG: DUF6891 domain-containing protein [Sciscionella sp.]